MWWWWFAGCETPWSAPALPPLAHELTGAPAALATEQSKNLVSGRFPSEVAKDCAANGPAFVWLAAHERKAAVVRAALFAAADCADALDAGDLAVAAGAHVFEGDRRTLLAALTAAQKVIADVPADHPLVGRLVLRATDPDPVVRDALLDVLDRREWRAEPAVAQVFFGALHTTDADWLVSATLVRVVAQARLGGLAATDDLRHTALVLVNDADAGIRGRAVLLLAELGPWDLPERDLVMAMLDDPHGYARSAASEALAEMGYVPAIHALLARLDDIERNTWDMPPYTRLDGTAVVLHHAGSEHERVDDAYLRAIARLSEPMGEGRFVYREVNQRWRDLDIIAATRDARKWYEARRAQIPALE